MLLGNGRHVIAYNGEVYNFRELREGLARKGVHCVSDTDTEVVLYLYALEGPEMLRRLNGMFAMAIWDLRDRTMFLARDRAGVKPLFYAMDGPDLWFASEIKALVGAGLETRPVIEAMPELVCHRFVAGEGTPFSGISRLLPGHYMTWNAGSSFRRRWWSLGDAMTSRADRSFKNATGWFAETFDSSVAIRRISDVPVGISLSGGLDSSSIAISLAQSGARGLASFTMRFDDPVFDEGLRARRVAELAGLEHHELYLKRTDLLEDLLRATWSSGEPLAHASDICVELIAREAKPHITVMLLGEGADELLGGYVRYQPFRLGAGLLKMGAGSVGFGSMVSRLGWRWRKLGRFFGHKDVRSMLLFNASDVLPSDLTRVGLPAHVSAPYRDEVILEAKRHAGGDLFREALYYDHHTYLASLLHRNDHMSMAASVEARDPFLDFRLLEGIASLPSSFLLDARGGKRILRRAIGARLPPEVLEGRKWGFAVPWGSFYRTEPSLRELLEGLPGDEGLRNLGCSTGGVRDTVRAFESGDGDALPLVHQLAMIALWHRVYFRERSRWTDKTILDARVRPDPVLVEHNLEV
jgi:asparagine synthase (glutamine-hydrolysing)